MNSDPIVFLRPRAPLRAFALAVATALTLAACGGGVDEPAQESDEAETIDTAGRLAIAENGSPTLRLHDLDSASLEASHTLDHAPSALYTSPGGRYAVAVQRTDDQVQFVDGGVWQEDHGDHLHDYRQGSRLVAWRLAGSRPTHYDVQAGQQAAFFMDGNAAATPVQNAGVRLFTDASIGTGSSVASLDLSLPIHGLGEPVGDKLLTVARAADAADTLPTHLQLYRRNGSSYTFDRELPTRCNGMHGSFSSGDYTVAGCLDGMLLVHHDSATTVSESFVSTPLRVGTIAGHPRLPGQFIGIATEGVAPAPVTTRFYALSGAAATAVEFLPEGWATGRVRRAHGFDRSGQRFYLLDDQGTLTVSQWQAGTWQPLARVIGVVPAMPAAAPWPAFAANGARDEVYLADPVAGQLVVIDSVDGTVRSRRALGFTPSAVTWLGITR
ncbi:MAG TPA: hypothetical protein VGD46_10290 [Rhizobacter sp.]